MSRKEYFDNEEKVRRRQHFNSAWEQIPVHSWSGEQMIFRCPSCGAFSQADYAICPVCNRKMFSLAKEDDGHC